MSPNGRSHEARIRRSSRLIARNKNNETHGLQPSTQIPGPSDVSEYNETEPGYSTDSPENDLSDKFSASISSGYYDTSSTMYDDSNRKERNREASRKTRERKRITEKRSRERLKDLVEHLIPAVEQEIRDVNQDIFLVQTALELSKCDKLEKVGQKSQNEPFTGESFYKHSKSSKADSSTESNESIWMPFPLHLSVRNVITTQSECNKIILMLVY